MCYSAQIEASYQRYVRAFGADIDIATFVRLYIDRANGSGAKIPKGMDAAFLAPASDWEREIKALIDAHDAQVASKLEQEVFKQKKRLADAERTLQTKTTKKALEDRRIATAKIDWALAKLANLRRTRPEPRDSRIFPGMHAPVLAWEDGRITEKLRLGRLIDQQAVTPVYPCRDPTPCVLAPATSLLERLDRFLKHK